MPRKVNAGSPAGQQSRGGRSTAARRAAALGAVVVGAAVFAAPAAQAALTTVGPTSPATGFPSSYGDANGVVLGLCIGPDPFCPLAPPNAAALTAPDGEAFYSSASATVNGPSGEVFTIAFDVEAAFFDATATSQVTFGRVQVNIGGAQGNGAYTITHPYGQGTWTAEPDGTLTGGNAAAQRIEVGCPAPPCDFTAAFASEIGPFLTWDPAVAPAAPSGYIGDGVSEHAVVGSPSGANSVTVTGPGLPLGGISTDQFVVEGKLAGPATPIFFVAAGSGSYGTQRVGTSVSRAIVVKNNGTAPASNITSAVISGPDAGQFTKGVDGCDNVGLASGETCTINVSFNPNGVGARNATLTVTDAAGPHTVPLTGTGGLPGVTTSPAIVNFLNQGVGTTSTEQQATVRNTGNVALNVTGAAVSGPNAGEFAISNNGCGSPVAPNATCTIGLKFLPGAGGVRNAMLNVTTDAVGSPHNVPLTGTGTGGAGAGQPGAGGGQATAVNGPGAAGDAGKPLGLGQLSISSRIKRAKVRKSGLRIVARTKDGTEYLRIRIYRKKRNGTKSTLAQGFRVIHTVGLYRTSLIDPRMRRDMSVGSYELEVTPGRSRDDLGTPAKYAFKVVK